MFSSTYFEKVDDYIDKLDVAAELAYQHAQEICAEPMAVEDVTAICTKCLKRRKLDFDLEQSDQNVRSSLRESSGKPGKQTQTTNLTKSSRSLSNTCDVTMSTPKRNGSLRSAKNVNDTDGTFMSAMLKTLVTLNSSSDTLSRSASFTQSTIEKSRKKKAYLKRRHTMILGENSLRSPTRINAAVVSPDRVVSSSRGGSIRQSRASSRLSSKPRPVSYPNKASLQRISTLPDLECERRDMFAAKRLDSSTELPLTCEIGNKSVEQHPDKINRQNESCSERKGIEIKATVAGTDPDETSLHMYYSLSPAMLDKSLKLDDLKDAGRNAEGSSDSNDESEELTVKDLHSGKDLDESNEGTSPESSASSNPEYFAVINKVRKHRKNLKSAPVSTRSVPAKISDASGSNPTEASCAMDGIPRDHTKDDSNVFDESDIVMDNDVDSVLLGSNALHGEGLLYTSSFGIGDHGWRSSLGESDLTKDGYCKCSFCNHDVILTPMKAEIDETPPRDEVSVKDFAAAHKELRRLQSASTFDDSFLTPFRTSHYELFRNSHAEDHFPYPKLPKEFMTSQDGDFSMSQLDISMNVACSDSDEGDSMRNSPVQKALQQDIEKHSSGVASVLNLCEVLLHDADACSNETEKKSIEQATESLDRRWRNICSLSMERKLKIEETQRLWKKFIEDYSRFSDWLRSAERVVTYPNTYMVCHKVAKEELKKFESFQRQVHESLTQLELINKQYRKLARENRTDATNKLRTMIHDGNSRWDGISHRVTSILRRLKHAINRREDFETRREALVVWLTETDLRLTNVEHFSRFGNHEKLKELKNFQVAIEEHIPQIIDLHTRGQCVLEKSEELDSVIIEEELVELQRYCREVVSRLDKYHRKLLRIMNEPPPLDSSLFEDTELAKMSWWERYIAETGSSRTSSPSGENERHSTTPRNPKKLHESISSHSGRASPESLEWDLYDISQSELETKDTGVLSDDGSIPEISPLEMDGDDIPLLHVSRDSNPTTPRQDATNASRRGHDTSHPDSSTPIKKPRTSKDEASQQKAQFFNDLAATLAWLDATDQVTDQEMNRSRPKYDKSVEELQREVNELKSLQKSIEQRKAIVLSINLVASSHTDSIDITRKLNKMNSNWEALQQKSTEWNKSLKESVKESQDFQTALETITEWVDEQNHRRDDLAMMQRRESPDSSPTSKLQALKKDQRALEKMKIDTSDAISKATSMQDICTHLSKPTSDPVHHVEGVRQVSEKVRTTNGRLKTLLDAVRSDLMDMERRIKAARRKVKEERSSDSGAESGDSSLTSGTPLRLRMLQRKVETSELHSSGKRNTEATGNMAASADDNTKHLSDVTQESYSSIEDVTPNSLHARQRREVKYKRQDNNLSRKTIIIEERSGIDVSVLAKRAESRPVAAILPLSDNKSAPLCRRVLLAALPFYIFFLLVLLLLWLLQTYSDDGFGCLRQNNYAYSFAPMLTYTNGPPPV